MCRRGFQDLLNIRQSSLFVLCGCNSSSIASLMSWSMCLVLPEGSFVSCSRIIWSRLMLCSITADLSVHASSICILCSLILIWIDQLLYPYHIHVGCCIHTALLMPQHPWQVEGSYLPPVKDIYIYIYIYIERERERERERETCAV